MSTIKNKYTYREFIDYCKNTPRSQRSINNGYNFADTGDPKWAGSKNLDEAFELAYGGWDAGLKQLALEDGVAITGGVEFMPSVCGSVVNIGNYLMGVPESMFETTELREYNLEPLTIWVPIMYDCGNNLTKAMKYCMEIIRQVNKYQSKNNVRLICFIDSNQSKGRVVEEIIVKDFDERFVLNNVAFSFHTSFFRRIWFRHLETTDYCSSGYGSPNDTSSIVIRFEQEIKSGEMKMTEKTLLIPQIESTDNGVFTEDQIIKYNF